MHKTEFSQASSNKSRASHKIISRKKSEVDEALFGNAKPKSLLQSLNDTQMKKVIQSVKSGDLSNPELVLIGEAELSRMRNNAVITSKEDQIQQKKIYEEQKERQQAAAKAKKQRMLQMEEEKKKIVPLTESQQEAENVKNTLQMRAAEIIQEQMDDVKTMNKMVMYAKCVTIRDKQLAQKKQMNEEMKIQEKRKDLMMEVDRLKTIKFYETQDQMKKEEQIRGHHVIIDQIKERELIRLKEKEEQEREGQVMLKRMQEMQKEEVMLGLKRKSIQKRLQDEILEANERSIVVKSKRYQEEKDEEDKIIRYNLEKAQKEAEYVAEQKRLKEEKEREVQRLREMQEKANDRQAELDALRAKRAMEQNERNARDKERREAEQKMKLNTELLEARKLQQIERHDRLQEQAKLERDEFQRIIQQQKQEREQEIRLQHEKEQMVKRHAEELRKQIALHEEKLKQLDREKLEEGKKIRDRLNQEKALIESIKESKLQSLRENNIPDKYTSELAKKKINI